MKKSLQPFQEVRFKVHDPKAHSKGGTLENTINGGRGAGDEDNPGPPPHILHPGKVILNKNITFAPKSLSDYFVLAINAMRMRPRVFFSIVTYYIKIITKAKLYK